MNNFKLFSVFLVALIFHVGTVFASADSLKPEDVAMLKLKLLTMDQSEVWYSYDKYSYISGFVDSIDDVVNLCFNALLESQETENETEKKRLVNIFLSCGDLSGLSSVLTSNPDGVIQKVNQYYSEERNEYIPVKFMLWVAFKDLEGGDADKLLEKEREKIREQIHEVGGYLNKQ